MSEKRPRDVRLLVIAIVLVLLVAAAFARAARNVFIDYDDPEYITANPHLRDGLTPETVAWAFTTGQNSNWHPLTWLSHALDVELFGVNGGAHHLVSVGMHALSAVLLFLALARMTGAFWRAGMVAALFAVHPLHVESVAWAAERKDVLSAVFGMLVLVAYAHRRDRPTALGRVGVPVLLALGLMAKPMLVTWPFVLLLLDRWPLRRREPARTLVVEKLPLFALAAASSAVTWYAQQKGGAVAALEALPFGSRLANAAVAYATYLVKAFWPVDLGILYPYQEPLPAWKVVAAALLLAAVTALVVYGRRRAPYLVTGWLWYVGTLVPVIGLVQVGMQSHADRYTYLPLIGVFIMLVWGAADLLGSAPLGRTIAAAAGGAAIAACSVLTWHQVGIWRDSITLFEHTLAVTTGNYTIHTNLGGTLLREGRLDEAIRHLEQARSIRPDHAPALSNLGLALQGKDKLDEAIALYRQAVTVSPSHIEAWLNLGNALELGGDLEGAGSAFRQAQRLMPGEPTIEARLRRVVERTRAGQSAASGRSAVVSPNARAWFDRGNALRGGGRLDEAAAAYREAIRIDPGFVDAHVNLGIALAIRGEADEAARQFAEALRLDPRDTAAGVNLGVLLVQRGRYDEAVRRFEEVLRLEPNNETARRGLDEARRRITPR